MSSLPSTLLPTSLTRTDFPTSSTSSSASSPTTTQGGSDTTTNATLYLYTFLATLVLLLAVSSAIVIRSLILRRRHHRLVEEAIRTGGWLPRRFDSTAGRRKRDIGQKPQLWEAWLHQHNDYGENENEKNEKRKWDNIMPVYAAYVNEPVLSPQGPIAGSAVNAADPPSRPPRFIRPFTRRRSPPSPQPTTASPMAGQVLLSSTSSPTTPTPAVRVAVLIAMPSMPQKHSDESGPPVVEIGVSEADVTDVETEPSSRDGS